MGDALVSGFPNPRGAHVLVNLHGIHGHPKHWAEPDAFQAGAARTWNCIRYNSAGQISIHAQLPIDVIIAGPSARGAGNLGAAIEKTAQDIAALRTRIVGFSSSFQQNVASVLLARHVRRLCPSAMVVIGGANMDAPMGAAFLSTSPRSSTMCSAGKPTRASLILPGRAWPSTHEVPP